MSENDGDVPSRPEWPPWTDVGIEWQREAWAYIQHLEVEIARQQGRIEVLEEELDRLHHKYMEEGQ